VATIESEVFERFKQGFARYASEHGADAALERLTELAAVPEFMNAHARAHQRRVPFDHEHASRTAFTRARNTIYGAVALPGAGRVAARRVRPAAARERRERPRARRVVASRDGPGELEPPPAPLRRRLGGQS
jgi:hypothetical protein